MGNSATKPIAPHVKRATEIAQKKVVEQLQTDTQTETLVKNVMAMRLRESAVNIGQVQRKNIDTEGVPMAQVLKTISEKEGIYKIPTLRDGKAHWQ